MSDANTDEPDIEPDDDEEPDSVVDMLIDAARGERRPLLNVLYNAAYGGPIDDVAELSSHGDREGSSASAVVAESLVTLLLSTGDCREQQEAYINLADRLAENGLCDPAHFNDVLMLLALDRGCETGFLPPEVYVKLKQYTAANHPEWSSHLDLVQPQWAERLN